MGKVIKFPVTPPEKLGPQKVQKRRRKDPEDFGQLNLFHQIHEGRLLLPLEEDKSFFDEALALDEAADPRAEQYYLKAIDAQQSVADAYCNLGILMSRKDDSTKAIDYLSKCLRENSRHFEAHYNMGNVYSEIGNYPLAKIHYEVAIELEPSFSNSYYNIALVHISLKNYPEAQKVLNTYLTLTPDFDQDVAQDLMKTLNSFK